MTADSVFDRMEARNLEILGEWATYSAKKDVPRRVRVWFESETGYQVDNFQAVAFADEYSIEARLDSLKKEPDKGETFELRGMRFRVESVAENDGRTAKVTVRRVK